MTTLVTTAGTTHINERNNGDPLTNVFDALELGQGNVGLAVLDNRTNLTSKIGGSLVQVASGYPIQDDQDIRNEGRGADVYTWKFVYAEGTQALIASNSIVTNYDAGAPSADEPAMIHAREVLTKRVEQELTVFVNVSEAGAGTLVAHVADGNPLTEQVATWRAQSISLGGAPGATPVSNGIVQSKLNEGEQAWIGSRMLAPGGGVMTRDDVVAIRLTALKLDRERDWLIEQETALNVYGTMPAAPMRTDPHWRGSAGYTFAHAWLPPSGWGSRWTRLEYTFTLTNGTPRTLVHEIEWQSVRSL